MQKAFLFGLIRLWGDTGHKVGRSMPEIPPVHSRIDCDREPSIHFSGTIALSNHRGYNHPEYMASHRWCHCNTISFRSQECTIRSILSPHCHTFPFLLLQSRNPNRLLHRSRNDVLSVLLILKYLYQPHPFLCIGM